MVQYKYKYQVQGTLINPFTFTFERAIIFFLLFKYLLFLLPTQDTSYMKVVESFTGILFRIPRYLGVILITCNGKTRRSGGVAVTVLYPENFTVVYYVDCPLIVWFVLFAWERRLEYFPRDTKACSLYGSASSFVEHSHGFLVHSTDLPLPTTHPVI